MKTETIRCRDLMVGDWVANRNGSLMQIVAVDEDNAYACEGNEERPWIFGDDKGYEPQSILLTPEILEKNGWQSFVPTACTCCQNHLSIKNEGDIHIEWNWKDGTLSVWVSYSENEEGTNPNLIAPIKYVHDLQDTLRLIGLNEMANNFKI